MPGTESPEDMLEGWQNECRSVYGMFGAADAGDATQGLGGGEEQMARAQLLVRRLATEEKVTPDSPVTFTCTCTPLVPERQSSEKAPMAHETGTWRKMKENPSTWGMREIPKSTRAKVQKGRLADMPRAPSAPHAAAW